MMKKTKSKRILKRTVFIIAAAALVCIVCGVIMNIHVLRSAEGRIVTPSQAAEFDADCILVLGAGVRKDGSPSPMLNDRMLTALELYDGGVCSTLLVSGDHGREDYDEVNTMKDIAVEGGVPSESVFMDHAGFSTYESLYRADAVFCAEKVIIVTQGYHLPRALYIADKLGIDAVGVASDRRDYAGQLMRDIREVLARDKDFIKCIFKPLPTYLGDAVPVSSDGNLTNDREV